MSPLKCRKCSCSLSLGPYMRGLHGIKDIVCAHCWTEEPILSTVEGSNLDRSFLCPGWSGFEEMALMEAISNPDHIMWENVSTQIGSKSPEDCRSHFIAYHRNKLRRGTAVAAEEGPAEEALAAHVLEVAAVPAHGAAEEGPAEEALAAHVLEVAAVPAHGAAEEFLAADAGGLEVLEEVAEPDVTPLRPLRRRKWRT